MMTCPCSVARLRGRRERREGCLSCPLPCAYMGPTLLDRLQLCVDGQPFAGRAATPGTDAASLSPAFSASRRSAALFSLDGRGGEMGGAEGNE